MATYSVARAKHVGTLTASAVDTVTVTGDSKYIEVKNRGATGDIYFTVNAAVPTIGGDNTYIVSAGEALQVPSMDSPDVIKLICSVDSSYSVTGIR